MSQLSFEPWWWQTAPRPDFVNFLLPKSCDVAIIGAGLTGLSAALTLARAGRSVCVLEAQSVGYGASTRNGGMIGSGHRVSFGDLAARYGEKVAQEVLCEGLRALEFATGLIKSENMECDYVKSGRFRCAWRARDYEVIAREIEFLGKKIGLQADMVPKTEQHREVVTDSYHGGCIFHSHGGLNPAKFNDGIAQGAERAGAQIFGKTPVTGITKVASSSVSSSAGGFSVQTSRGELMARDVIVASNGYTSSITPELRRRLIPISSYMIATEPLGRERVKSLIPGLRMIVESRSRTCYYRPSPDGMRILLGGRAALRQIDPALSLKILRGLLVGLFPSLSDVAISHSWLGTLGFSTDHLPHIGSDEDGIHYAMGYSGSGVAMAPYLGWRVANKVLGNAEGKTAFDAIDFNPVRFRTFLPIGLPFVEMWYRFKDIVEGS